MVSVLLSTNSLTECLLSSWALEWQEWAPHKPPEWAEDLYMLVHHDSLTQTHQNTHNTEGAYMWVIKPLVEKMDWVFYGK